MSNLKQLRIRVKSVKSTQKITKAMQLVSASKLKKLKERAERLNDYSKVLESVIRDLSLSRDLIEELPYLEKQFFGQETNNLPILLIVITSERGLCGGFNSSLIKYVKKDIESLSQEGKKVKLLMVGKKGYDLMKGSYLDSIEDYIHIAKENIENIVLTVRDKIINLAEKNEIGACTIYYNKFKNALTQDPTRQKIMPFSAMQDKSIEEDGIDKLIQILPKYEYEGKGLERELIDLYLGGYMHYSLLQSKAGEEGARMTAMDNATRNAGELIDKLTLNLNRSRQAIITTELTEIISGAEAL